jgi:sarcosine oxidase subunit beta
MIENCPVTAIDRLNDLWRVHAGDRFFDAQVLANCAGAWSGRIAAMIGDKVPLTPEALTMMVTARKSHFLDPVVGLTSRKLSFKQMPNGTVVIGGGHRSRLNLEKEHTHIDISKMSISAQTASDIFPIIRNTPVIRCWAGIEGFLPDQIPVIGPSQAAPDAFHAFGFSGHGFQLSPIVGKIMADLITQGQTDLPIAPFRIDRFSAS